ncbi:acylphosphatase [Salinicoccus sp. YB14-2]|uniref:ATP-binding protein n=1 Tax=Salinicoccus sp. YB14-2 TaxID=1572701 RepID=UPI00069116DC|nr:acylphosphatase [Salinicoccus sp. YB14-2]
MTLKELDFTKDIMLNHPIEAQGPSISMYRMTLEAWRRGIEVKFMTVYVKNQIKIRHKLSYGGKEFRFQLSLGDKVAKEARQIGKSKELTKAHLSAAGVSVPEGKVISVQNNDFAGALDYADSIGYPVIVKPAHASLAIGVRTNLNDRTSLAEGLEYVHGELGYTDIIVERHATGFDTRAYVIEDQLIAAFKRVAAHIEGDGEHTIRQLIEIKNQHRKLNPHLSASQIKIDKRLNDFIGRQGYSLDTVPVKGDKVNLTDSTFAKDASDTVDITENVSEDYILTAVNAVKSVPGMNMGGVDIIRDEEKDTNNVLEINCRPDLGGHMFPIYGKSRDVSKKILDYYFPETASIDKGINDYFTFDFDKIFRFLKKGIVKEVILPPLPKGDIKNVHLVLSGNVNYYKNIISNSATGHRLGGHIKMLKNGKARIVAAGTTKHLTEFLENLLKIAPKLDIKVEAQNEWDSLLMYKFEASESTGMGSVNRLRKESMAMKEEITALKKELAVLKREESNL